MREIAAYLGWRDDDVRDALDRLAELKLLHQGVDVPNRVVSPQVGLFALLARSEAELAHRQRQIEASRSAIADLAQTYGAVAGMGAEILERLDGVAAVRDRLVGLSANAQEECMSLSPGGAQTPDAIEASRALDESALARGVRMRSLYQDSVRNDALTMRHLEWLASLGAEVRTVAALPIMLVIVDRQVALVPIEPSDPRQGALVMHSHGAVAAMVALFEQFWSVGVALDPTPVRDGEGLSAQERELLRLLANGDTDESVSRKLGLSLRTARRLTATLMSRLDARSRFEAGVRAARRGWV
ncbi:helix-turn-helix transcriptional regulator [Plantactinospora alkalitolerans]|uniref:helix-turn-helix transcriptional regulator n=1 Tax=Plantactinospora alkalitolerans TaxID=2789879 RepID=UPI002B201DA5|nr:helix-turn-helix transcriptional regulator [Plantactinospora alkalitolerans]